MLTRDLYIEFTEYSPFLSGQFSTIVPSFNHRFRILTTSTLFVWACLTYKPYFFSQQTVFFSHTKSTNSTFSRGLSAKQAQTNRTYDCAILQVCHSLLKPLRRELFNGKELKSKNIGECCCLMLTLLSKRAWN